MPDALIFDFDGVLVDSEPLHMMAFQQALRPLGVELTEPDYYEKYLGFDDFDCFRAVLRDHGREVSEPLVQDLAAGKTRQMQELLAERSRPLPGSVQLAAAARASGWAVGICSGALREEIVIAGEAVGVLEHVQTVVAALDVQRGKPDPEGYAKAFAELQRLAGRPLEAGRSVAVEDSPPGIEAAKGAGLRVLAVTNSYPPEALTAADRVVDSLEGLGPADLDDLVATAAR
jgi:HAD superfamily hydrolase (TIGR01509 family)